MPDPIDWQARCIAAEVALGMITGAQSQEEVVAALGNLPDLTAARELIAKAEAQAEEMDRWAERWWNDHSEITSCDFSERARDLRAEAARLRGGGK